MSELRFRISKVLRACQGYVPKPLINRKVNETGPPFFLGETIGRTLRYMENEGLLDANRIGKTVSYKLKSFGGV